MVAYKIFKSGDNYEIYEMQYRDIKEKPEQTDEEQETWDFPVDEDRQEERRMQTLRDNKNNLKRMARENFQGKNFFVTLTFAENFQDIDKADRRLKYFIKKLRKDYGAVSFIGVREKQKRGAIHYHLLLKNEKIREYFINNVPGVKRIKGKTVSSKEQKAFEQYMLDNYWTYGYVNFTMIDFVDDVGAYLGKYLTKGKLEEMKWLECRRLILRSTDIKKIEPLDEVEDSDLFHAIVNQMDYIKSVAKEDIKGNLKRKRVFTNGYKTKYQGQMSYFDVHLNRLAESQQNE